MDPLNNKEFLKELFSQHHRETYARITALNIDEEPLEQIEGRVTSGSVNLDGSSSLRRTCNLSLISNLSTALNDYYWTLNSKFKLMFGLKNTVDPQYPDIIWFKLGTYIITNFSYSYSTAGMNISISGKDKMCLINGDVSGAIYASVDFGTREEVDSITGEKTLVDIEIEDIIREAVHEYAREPWERIIIKDLPKYGLFLLEWTADVPIYVLIPTTGQDEGVQAIINQDVDVYINGGTTSTKISNLPHYMTTNDLTLIDKTSFTVITLLPEGENSYLVCRILPGQSAGYDVTELTYPRNGEESGLITGVGDTVTTVLDKIIEFLGDYEYFYDVDGNFIFQKKNKYIDTNWNVNDFNTTSMGNDYDLTAYLQSTWLFEGNELVVSINNTPNLNNIKNDYSIWGERQIGDDTIPIHMRYAVDKKPQYYKSIFASADELAAYKELYPEFKNGFNDVDSEGNWPSQIYCTDDFNESLLPVGVTIHKVDWREIIYQMALDYRRFNHFDTFNMRILHNNILPNGEILYPKGITGYEQYYVDLEGFWRYLYRPDYDSGIVYNGYNIKTIFELNMEEPIYINDHFETGSGNYHDYYSYGNYKYVIKNSNNEPEFLEKPYIIDIKKQLEDYAPMVFERFAVDEPFKNWWQLITKRDTGEPETYDNFYDAVLAVPQFEGNDSCFQKSRCLYYQNGTSDLNYYNSSGDIKQYETGCLTYAFNLLVPCVTINLEKLQEATTQNLYEFRGQENWPETVKFCKQFNSYTVYKITDNEYYILNKIKKDGQSGEELHYKLERVRVSFDGVKDYLTGEYIYRSSNFIQSQERFDDRTYNQLKANYTKLGIIDFLPSTFTTKDLYYTPSKDYNLDHYQCWDEKDYQLRKLMMIYQKYTPYFNFDVENPLFKSSIKFGSIKTYMNINNTGDYIGFYFDSNNDIKQYYTYIDTDNFGQPINNSYKHEPIAYYQEVYSQNYDESYLQQWNTLIEESPELLLFWFDFLDSQTSEIGKYGANNIMDRSKANNDSKVKAIYYRDTLNIVYQRLAGQTKKYDMLIDQARSGQNIIQAGAWVWDQFKVSSCGKSCKDVLDQWLQAYTQANENINFNCIPIYTLEPNNRISIQDDNTKINGEYVINSINIPLTFNGTMSVNATKAVSKLQ